MQNGALCRLSRDLGSVIARITAVQEGAPAAKYIETATGTDQMCSCGTSCDRSESGCHVLVIVRDS